MGKNKQVRQKRKTTLSTIINKGKTRGKVSTNGNGSTIDNFSRRFRSAKTKPTVVSQQAQKRITFAKPISATRTFLSISMPSQMSDISAKSTPQFSKKHEQVQEQKFKPILRSSSKLKSDNALEQKKDIVAVNQEIVEETNTPLNSRVMRSGLVVNTKISPSIKQRRRSHEIKGGLPVAIVSIKQELPSPFQEARPDDLKAVAEIYGMVTRSGRQVQDFKQGLPDILLKPIKQEPEHSLEYENAQTTSTGTEQSHSTPKLAQTAPYLKVTRSHFNRLVKTVPVNKETSAVTSALDQDEVKIVRQKNSRKRKAVQIDLTSKVPRRTRASDVFPMDDVSKKYFPCPVPFCDQRCTDRTTRNYHLRHVHPDYEYKDGDGWEKIREQPSFDRGPDAMTEAAVAPVGASDSRPTSPDSPPPNAPSPPAVVPTSTTQDRKTTGSSAAQRQNEALAFAKFLVAEEQRLRKLAPQLSAKEIEKMITQKWMSLKPNQRLQYLIKKGPDALSSDQKQILKRKLDEQLDSIKEELAQITPKLPSSVPSPGPIRLRISKAAIEAARTAQFKIEPSSKKHKTPKQKPFVAANDFPEIDPFDRSVEQVQSIVGRAPIQEERLKLEMMEDTLRGNRQLSNFQVLTKHASSYHEPRMALNSGACDALHLYYMALCEPAFPRPDDRPLTEHRAEHYWEQYLNLSRL